MPRPVKKKRLDWHCLYEGSDNPITFDRGWNSCCSAWESWLPTERELMDIIAKDCGVADYNQPYGLDAIPISAIAKAISERLRGKDV